MKVFLTEPIHAEAVAMLEQHSQVIRGDAIDADGIIRQAQDCDAILVRSAYITDDILGGIPSLRVVAKHGIGVDNIDVAAATQRGILVLNAPLSNINAVAEHTLAMMLAVTKHLALLDRATRETSFARRSQFVNVELSGKTVGLVGLGKIARLLARKLACLDVSLIASDPFAIPEDAESLGVQLVELDALLRTADIVSLHTPLLDSTRRMIGEESLIKMKPTAYLINVARGALVDEKALYRVLSRGDIAGAALDVFDPEPPELDNPLLELENVLISPHNAALTDRALLSMAMDSATGIVDFLEDRVPLYPVNPECLSPCAHSPIKL